MAFVRTVLRDAATAPKGENFILKKEYCESGVLTDGNGETSEHFFAEVQAGMPVAKLSDGSYRPMPFNSVSAATNTTAVTVSDTSGLTVGDSIYVYDNDDDTKISGSATAISAIDTATGVVTVGATLNVAIGDYVIVDTCDAALSVGDFGLLAGTTNTVQYVDDEGVVSHSSREIEVLMRGVVNDTGIVNYSAALRRRLGDRITVVDR